MKLARSVFNTYLDIVEIGPGFLLRHVSALLGREAHCAQIPGYGDVYMRSRHSDAQTFRQIFARKEYCISESHAGRVQTAYDRILAAGRRPLIIDAGANVGAASIWFAMQYPKARVIAVEPEPENVAMCKKNVACAPNVRVIEAAVGANSGYVSLTSPGTESWAVRTMREVASPSPAAVPVVTFHDLIRAEPRQELFIAKVDIEGFELDLFSENLDWLDSVTLLIVEPHDWMLPGAYTSASLQRAVLGRGFELLISGENLVFVR